MAIYHLSAKVVSRGKGQSAIAAAAYRSGDPLVDEQTGELKSYEQRSLRIIHTEIMAPRHAPEWAWDRNALWNAAVRAEKRKDAQLARELEVSLPHELTEQQREYLIKDFAREAFVRRGYAVDVAIHTPDGNGDLRNHHAHLMITMRVLGPDGFAPTKDRSLNSTEQLETWREQWAKLANRHLARHGHTAQVDHRSLKEQGIDREATTHVGYAGNEISARGAQSDRMDAHDAVLERNDIRVALRAGEEELAQLRELVANENWMPGPAPALTREPRSMADGPTDDELRKQLETETKYLKHMEAEHGKVRAVLEERRHAHELDQRVTSYQQAKEIEAEEGRKKAAQDATESRDGRNGDISSASARYSIALGENYDVRDPYASLARAAGAEAAAFHKNQEKLRAEAAKETDPDKRQAIDLRRKIEGCDYMAVTSERLVGISEAVTGRPGNSYAIADRQQAAHWRATAAALREERSAVLETVQAKEVTREEPTRPTAARLAGRATEAAKEQTNAPAADRAKEPVSPEPRERFDARPHYRTEMPATAPASEASPAQTEESEKGKDKGEQKGEGNAAGAAARPNYRQVLSPEANVPRPPAELRVADRDGKDVGTLSDFMQREQVNPRLSESYQPPKMQTLISDPRARGEHHRWEAQLRDERQNTDKALGRIGGDLEKGRTVKAEDLRSLTREQWDNTRVKGEAALVQTVRKLKDHGPKDAGMEMGGGPKPRRPEP